jgi:hypothetical protein
MKDFPKSIKNLSSKPLSQLFERLGVGMVRHE